MDFYEEVVVVTRYKEICQSHIIEVMKSLPPETEYLMELLNEVACCPDLNVSSFLMDGDI